MLVDGDNGIIAGHGRVWPPASWAWKRCRALSWRTWRSAKKAYIIADNKLALNVGWDNELLALELGELHALILIWRCSGLTRANCQRRWAGFAARSKRA